MKVLFYSPYVPDHFGGGEKHFFDVATTVAKRHSVYIALPQGVTTTQSDIEKLKTNYESFLNYSLDAVIFTQSKLKTGSVFEKLQETNQYDYVYYVTDGSFFLSLAKKNNLHIQIPFTQRLGILEKIKLASWNIKNTNSNFTKQVIEKSWQTKIDFVHNPLVSLEEIQKVVHKEKIILNVGRFFKQLHSKRQDVLVTFFKKLFDENKSLFGDWKLVLVGSVEDQEYLNEVLALAKGYPIEIKTKVSRTELITLYQKAAIYWHATGFNKDEEQEPEKVEHFGITTIEAMAAGCVPIVINKGGQKEILGTKLKKLLWNSESDCLAVTKQLIKYPQLYTEYQNIALEQVTHFSKEKFEKIVWEMF